MKYLTLALLLLSFNSLAATSIKKTFDGGEAKCLDQVDVGLRAYNLKVQNEVIIGDSRVVTLKVNYYKCAEVPSGYGLRESSALEVLSSFILLPDGKTGMTKNTLVSSQFFATDYDGKVLGVSALINSNNLSTITFTVNKNINRIFVDAKLISNISSPIGSLEGVEQMYGGFVLTF